MSDIEKILVPDVGGDEVEVIEICFAVGDSLEADEGIITVETDKASMDIPAPFAGELIALSVKVGDKIKEGDVIAEMKGAGAAAEDSTEAPVAAESEEKAEPEAKPEAPAAEKTPSAAASSEVIEIAVPDIGEDGEVDVIEVLVAVGDVIEAEDGLITLETDKATMDVPSPHAGTVKEVLINTGDKVKQGSIVIKLETSSSAAEQAPAAEEAPAAQAPAAEKSAPAAAASSEVIEIAVPDIGEDGEVDVIDVLVAVGDVIEAEDGLITLETDKATMDVPSSHAGTVKEVLISTGDKVKQGSIVIKLETSSGAPAQEETPAPASAPAKAASQAPAPAAKKAAPVPHHPQIGLTNADAIYTSPSIRRIAREFGVDLTLVKGTGRKGRILKEDVQSYVKYELSRPKANAGSSVAAGEGGLQVVSAKQIDFSKFGEVETKALTRIQKISGPFLHRNWVTIPHVTQFDEADITNVEAFRKEQNVICEKQKLGFKITPLVFILKAAADALRTFPTFNSSLSEDGESLILKKYIHIGVAVDTPNGLVVPVVRDVDQKGIHQLSRELLEISIKARDGKLKATDMQGGCFTISSLGGIGGTAFTPIVNAPEVAILGVSKSEMKPKWNGQDFEPKLMLPLSMSYDHRVIDGALAARFTVHLAGVMSDIRKLIL
ncbi:pyruvate dehydrogenase complex dihydrolipoyllysine-residue acetyltransferase [Cognaticolwellia beringensis]|uniref:Acetyltransferase component of pyruvate dehydrogenase complex n=1 Tax=Cognaticolwellia beringensis TaxID=1967665 RepID=A0A222G372_9GAMM|nr:pyruvate dehydrogenase complex dihydrolipoyllysine-residue acetyltransferase [Cognaticolwellia beringensis]ASP46386.1 pyruvate dehydrogenase complex dihydrolipoyllysine-residue acetyltransferase [Cognaticolwellia beringensis]